MSVQAGVEPARAPRRIALAGGGTAGHLSPALAVAAAYRARCPEVEMLFIGEASGFGARLLDAHGYRLEPIPAAPFFRVPAPIRVRAASQLVAGVRHGRRMLARAGVQLVIGFGAYASAGAVLAARSLGLATAVHECNAVPGLTNRLLGHIVDRVYLGELTAVSAFAAARVRVTGTPVRPEIASLAAELRQPPRSGRLRLLVCGGSEGSPFLNRRAAEPVRLLVDGGLTVEVRHQSGQGDPAAVQALYAALGLTADVTAYLTDMVDAYRWADLAVTAAGAITLAEMATAGLPAFLVPLGAAAADHQAPNAAAFAAATGSPWVREREWSAPDVARRLAALASDPPAWTAISERGRALARPEAADAIVADCEALLGRG